MTSERKQRIRELAWRTYVVRERPVFLARLPGNPVPSIQFLDLDETKRVGRLFSESVDSAPEVKVRDFAERWPEISSLWDRGENVLWLPITNWEIGYVLLPFGYLADHIDFFLGEDGGNLHVADPDLRRGFSYLSGEMENVLQWWPRHTGTTRVIQDWFQRSGGGGLKTPTGWFGRPHDSIHQCTYAEQRDGHLLLELDNTILILVGGACQVSSLRDTLTISKFAHAILSWKEYGGEQMHLEAYSDGEISFIAPPG
jgi:hypothetical protein